MRIVASRLARHVGRRGAFLLFLALLDGVVAYSLTQPLPLNLAPRVVYGPMMDIAPITWWAGWWAATSALCLSAAAWRRAHIAAFGAGGLIKAAWAACYLTGWVEHLPLYTRGYQTAAIYVAFAGVVLLVAGWRENGS